MENLKEIKRTTETIIENNVELEKVTTYYSNGQLKREEYFKGYKYHREGDKPAYIEYYPSDQVQIEKYYKDNKLHRDGNKPAYIWYHEDGRLFIEKYYKEGKLHRDNDKPSDICYSLNGQVNECCYYKEGKKHRANAPAHIYHEEGEIVKRYYMYGIEIEYNSDIDPYIDYSLQEEIVQNFSEIEKEAFMIYLRLNKDVIRAVEVVKEHKYLYCKNCYSGKEALLEYLDSQGGIKSLDNYDLKDCFNIDKYYNEMKFYNYLLDIDALLKEGWTEEDIKEALLESGLDRQTLENKEYFDIEKYKYKFLEDCIIVPMLKGMVIYFELD